MGWHIEILCAACYTFGGVGELYQRRSPFLVSLRCADHRPIKIGGEQERPITAPPVMTKSRGPSWGQNNYPENGEYKLDFLKNQCPTPPGTRRQWVLRGKYH